MENTLIWSPSLKLSDYENFAIANALKYSKGNMRQASDILNISVTELGSKLASFENRTREIVSEIDYWRQHKRIVERFTNGLISKEEFDEEIKSLNYTEEVEPLSIEKEKFLEFHSISIDPPVMFSNRCRSRVITDPYIKSDETKVKNSFTVKLK